MYTFPAVSTATLEGVWTGAKNDEITPVVASFQITPGPAVEELLVDAAMKRLPLGSTATPAG
jgi:hypothetical protein